jgi:YegS/Rv2252/BmrU family lipid kinase
MSGDDTNFRTLLVANPQSANGALGRKWSSLEQTIRSGLGAFEHRFTERKGDATRLARRALEEGYEMVVAMGGDGTISEVADGFFTAAGPLNPAAVLGVLPFGTGGDFRKTIGAPKQLAAGAASLRGRRTQRIDVGRLTYTPQDGGERRSCHFINIASFGIGGLVDELVNASSKALGGRVSFAWATFRAMLRFKPQRARLRLDEGEPSEVLLHNIAVANGRFFGGGMEVAPDATLDDGRFDVITLGPMSMADLLLRGHRIYKGTHLSLPQVSAARARRVEAQPVDPGERILLDVDGEVPGMLPATFELLPGALLLKTPEAPTAR